jgi:hypothetical protein
MTTISMRERSGTQAAAPLIVTAAEPKPAGEASCAMLGLNK